MEVFDIGIVMGSQSTEIFEQAIALHPGAQKFYDNLRSHCECGMPGCGRVAVQVNLDHLFGDDKKSIIHFFDELKACDGPASDQVIQTILADMGFLVSTGEERQTVEERVQEVIQRLFPGAIVLGLDPDSGTKH